jgi:NitT/TauT family transport system permease protein
MSTLGPATAGPPAISPDSAQDATVAAHRRATAAARRRRERLLELAVRVGSLVCVLVVWELYGRSVNQTLFAPPTRVFGAAIDMLTSGELWSYFSASLRVLAIGFVLSLGIGIPLGLAIARSQLIRFALDWYVDAFNSTPNVALVPLITLVFGFDVTAKVIVVVLSSVFAVIVNTEQGVLQVDRRLLEVARSFRSSERQLWGDVIIPSALPYIAAGLRLAVGRALVGMVVAEFFTSITGVGYLIVRYSNSFQPDHLLVPIVLVMALGIVLTTITRALEKRLAPWSAQASREE